MPADHVPTALKTTALALSLLVPLPSTAQEFAVTTPEAFLELLETLEAATQKPRLVVVQGVPTATTMPGGSAFASVSGTTKREGGSGVDGSLAFGIGFGDARETVGAQIVANITSTHPSDFGDSGSLSFKLSRTLPEAFGNSTVGLTFDDLAPWGDADGRDVRTSLAWTSARQIRVAGERIPLLLNLGVVSETSYHDDWTPFAAVGLGLSENLSMTIAHNGDYPVIGATTRVPGLDDVSFSASLQDVFDERNERRVTLTASIAFNDLF